MDFHSFPWLLKCHRVFWFECKVAQLAPIMLNVKTCEDSLLNQPCDRQQNTSHVIRPPTSGPLTTVDPLTKPGQNYSWKKMHQILSRRTRLSTSISDIWSNFSDIFHPVNYVSQGCFEPIRLNGFVVVVNDHMWQNNVINLRNTPWQITCLPCYCFYLCVCEVI